MEMTLGDGFTRRKQIQNDINKWLSRLRYAGREEIHYSVVDKSDIDISDNAIPGTVKEFKRAYSISECIEKIENLIEEDKILAKRISLTNQRAGAVMINLKGEEETLTIPELIILKNEIAPKILQLVSDIPTKQDDLHSLEDVEDRGDKGVVWRKVNPITSRTRIMTDNNMYQDVDKIVQYNIKRVNDFGYSNRQIYDKEDKVNDWIHRIKEAINQANKTKLIELE